MTTRRQLLPFAALSASYFAHVGFFNPYMPLWLKELGFDIFSISLLTTVQASTRLFAPYAWGWVSDRTGERVKLLRFAATVALFTSLGLWFNPAQGGQVAGSGAFWWLAVVILVLFTHTSSMMSMSEAAMAHLVTQGGVLNTRLYGRVRVWGSVGFLVTVFAAGTWFERFGMKDLPGWTTLTLLAVVVSVWAMPDLKEKVPAHEEKLPVLPILRQRPVQWLFASIFFHVLSHVSIYAFFSLYLDSLGYGKSMIGLLWGVAIVVEVIWFFTQGFWMPHLSLTAWLVLCALVMVARMGITAAGAMVLPLLVLAQALHAITFAAHHSVCVALISHHFPGRLRGRGQALFIVTAYGLPGVLGGLAGGALSVRFGLSAVFWACLATSALACVCALRVWRFAHPRVHAAR